MSLLDLICPTRCSGCGASGALVCDLCAYRLDAPARRHVPTPCPAAMPETWVVATYDGPVRALLLDFKERGVAGLARPLSMALARAVTAAQPERGAPVVLVPVPSSPRAVRQRGDDVVRMLAARAAGHLRAVGRPVRSAAVLAQRRRLADSAGLSAAQRAANLAGGLAVRPSGVRRIDRARVVIVDDLVTTGTTLSEAHDALCRSGAVVVGAAAIAATRLRFGPGRPMDSRERSR